MKQIDNIYYEIFKTSPLLIAVTDYKTGEFIQVNDEFIDKLGYAEKDIIGSFSKDLGLFPDITEYKLVQKELRTIGAFKNRKLLVRDQRGQLHMGVFSGRVFENDGHKCVITTMSDITRYTEKEQFEYTQKQLDKKIMLLEEINQSLEVSEYRNKAIVNVIPDMLFIYDEDGYFVDCQTNDETNLFMSKEYFIGKHMSDIMPAEISEKGIECIQKTIIGDTVESFEYDLVIEGKKKYFETRMVKSSAKEVLAIVRDITASKKEQDLILKLSYKDPLTGVYNRRYFEELMDKIDTAKSLPTSLFMIDVNGLKLTNDAFGHLVGDELLKKVASTIQETCPSKAAICRIGGDEFVIVIVNYSQEESNQLTDQIYQVIDKIKCGETIVSISIGYETRVSLDSSLREIFIEAENNMFRRKLVESQSMRHQTIIAILHTLNEKNQREKRHSEQVSKLSRQIGKQLGYQSHELKEIEMAGLLHDIGKIAVREEVLNKPGKLTDEEYSEIKKHSESGYHILKTVDEYSSLAEVILSHHERIDGKGYPRGLKGEQIPELSKIIAVADAYEAMVSDRSYRKGTTHEKAIQELIRCSGTQFDLNIVDAFINSFL